MRRLLLLAPLALLAFPSSRVAAQRIAREADVDASTFSGVIQEHYPDGRPRLWKQLVNGRAEGLWLEWYPDGTLRFRTSWRDGKGDGRWEYFHPNGRLRSEDTYAADLSIGLARQYHENGAVASERTYVNGTLHGIGTDYDVTGMPTRVQRWEYGTRVIDRPEPFAPGVIATDDANEWGITFTPDGDTAYFTRRAPNGDGQRIHRSFRTADGWSEPQVAAFSTAVDESAFITPDGSRLYFASARPLTPGAAKGPFDMNLWMVERTASGWGAPRALPSAINRTMDSSTTWPVHYEAGPVTDADGNLYYWTGSARGTDADLFVAMRRADGSFAAPRALDTPPNHRGFDSSPAISPDGRYLVFASSGRSDGMGDEDLYVSRREGNGWSAPVSLGPDVNGPGLESCAAFSPDGRYFFFCSNRARRAELGEDAPSSIYYMETRFLMLPRDR